MIASSRLDELAAALCGAQAEFESVSKRAENPFFKSKYASLPDVVKAAAPILAKHDLSVVQFPGHDGEHDTLTTVVLHKSGQHLGDTMRLKPVKQDPQSQGSAMTYARRYSYMAALGLVADEDDDGNAASRPVSRAPEAKPAPELSPMQEAARQDLRIAYSAAKARWESLADSEKNAVVEHLGFPLPLQGEFNRRAREALNADVQAGTIDSMVAFTHELERLTANA